jgi:hypothetical protein
MNPSAHLDEDHLDKSSKYSKRNESIRSFAGKFKLLGRFQRDKEDRF